MAYSVYTISKIIYITPEMADAINKLSLESDKYVSQIVREALAEYLDKHIGDHNATPA